MNSQEKWISGILFSGIFALILSGIFSCRHDSDEIDLLGDVCFETEILPIFQTSCAISGCHDRSGESYSFTSYPGIMDAVTPGDPYGSPVYKALINIWSLEGMMPPNQPLSEYNRTLIRVWIQQGAKNNACPPPAKIDKTGKPVGTINSKPVSMSMVDSELLTNEKILEIPDPDQSKHLRK